VTAAAQKVVTSGQFSLDGGTWDVDNNVWLYGDEALELARELDAPVLLHPEDRMLWDAVHAEAPTGDLTDGELITVAGSTLRVVHTPGHSPGGVCLVGDGVVFSGDTLFHGGPGATGRSYSDFPTILDSIRSQLLTLPPETVVHTGHGDDTTVGAEAGAYDDWVTRGH
jgi:glyoxylase-like metal-dependent hydrolase (beta-lactamase superfamily II)